MVKIAIVVPYSWSFWGGVVDHAEQQVLALRKLGADAWLVIGNDPPGSFTHVLHPGVGRHLEPPDVRASGRAVGDRAGERLAAQHRAEPDDGAADQADLPARALRPDPRARADDSGDRRRRARALAGPTVATFHASGNLGWLRGARYTWGFLVDRIDRRIAVSDQARASAARWFPGEYQVVPNGVLVPAQADPANRENRVVFIGRHEPRKGMPVLLRAWPEIHRRTGARLRLVGADPLAVRLVVSRERVSSDGIDMLGVLTNDELTDELLRAKVQVASSLGGESFGMVLTRGLACAVPVVASDIPGYRAVMDDDVGVLVPPGDHVALADAVVDLLADEELRVKRGAAARALVQDRYSWERIAGRLHSIYEEAVAA